MPNLCFLYFCLGEKTHGRRTCKGFVNLLKGKEKNYGKQDNAQFLQESAHRAGGERQNREEG